MRKAFRKLIQAYRFFISPIFSALGGGCRFHPSCSEYAEKALENRPLGEAAMLIAKRLLKCGPWSDGGVDHVPSPGN